jgi:hypothetical protein
MFTLAPAVKLHQLELSKLASCDRIKKDYIIKEVPGHPMLEAASIVYPYESTDEFRDESLYIFPIQHAVPIYN